MQRAQHFGHRRQQLSRRHFAVALTGDRRKRSFLSVGFRDIEADRRRQDLRDGFVGDAIGLVVLDQFARGAEKFGGGGIDPAVDRSCGLDQVRT
jgi:hypothetical protein